MDLVNPEVSAPITAVNVLAIHCSFYVVYQYGFRTIHHLHQRISCPDEAFGEWLDGLAVPLSLSSISGAAYEEPCLVAACVFLVSHCVNFDAATLVLPDHYP